VLSPKFYCVRSWQRRRGYPEGRPSSRSARPRVPEPTGKEVGARHGTARRHATIAARRSIRYSSSSAAFSAEIAAWRRNGYPGLGAAPRGEPAYQIQLRKRGLHERVRKQPTAVIFRTGLQIFRERAGHPDCLVGEAGDLMHYDPKADVIHNLSRASLCDPNVSVPMDGIKLRTPPKQ
jgi:hypothetical protein